MHKNPHILNIDTFKNRRWNYYDANIKKKYNYYYDFSLFTYSAHSLKSLRKEQEANLAKKNPLAGLRWV